MSDRELSDIDELVEIDDRTNPDGTVDVTIEGWERVSSSYVKVEFGLVTDTTKEKMKWPQFGDDMEDYKFYRIVKESGLNMRNADLLEGSDARARRSSSGSWLLVAPEYLTTVEKVHSMLSKARSEIKLFPLKETIVTLVWLFSVLALSWSVISVI
jgi:hypothetical protein